MVRPDQAEMRKGEEGVRKERGRGEEVMRQGEDRVARARALIWKRRTHILSYLPMYIHR